jgi:hypothetical protein
MNTLDLVVPGVMMGGFCALVAAAALANRRRRARSRYIASFEFPQHLRAKLRDARPGLTAAQEEMVFAALRQFFQAARIARGRFVSMPSKVVDDAWHGFILSTRAYRDFCKEAFGRFLHHTPAEAMPGPQVATEGIRRTWNLACRLEKIDPKAARTLPLLFAIDARLDVADGYRYDLVCGPTGTSFCASHIGCGSGCGGGGCAADGSSDGGGDGGGGDGGGCGGGGD